MRSAIVATVLALATLAAVPALAAPAMPDAPNRAHRAEGEGERRHFPLPAAEFQAKVNVRQARARAHMEARAAKLAADEAKELRAKFEARIGKVNAEVAKAVADGKARQVANSSRRASGFAG